MPSGQTSLGYLFTDIDGSTERWERAPQQMELAVARHNRIVDAVISRHGGTVRDRAGDGVFAVFDGGEPLACALAMQLAIQREDWESVGGLRLRIGVHAGSSENSGLVDQIAINRAARITSSAWPGQIVVSAEATRAFAVPSDCWVDDLGFCQLRGIEQPLHLCSLAHADLQRTEFPPLRALASVSRPLADLQSPFFGREHELDEVKRMLASPGVRLLNLVGPGGNGKTRLAARIAAEYGETGATWFVSLEGVWTAAAAVQAVAQAFRFPFHGAAPHADQLAHYLRDKQGLLLLDNAEGLADGADVIDLLASACPGLRFLATSRRPLGIAGETLFNVGGFKAPADPSDLPASGAYQLFVHYARAAQPGFELDRTEFAAFRELCSMVDGSPLAILLAAQWRHLLSLDSIVARIRADVGFLRALEPTGPARHRSLTALLDGTWALLSGEERVALAKLSIFRGGFDAEAAEAVTGLDLATLTSLQGRGLVEQRTQRRCSMHPLIQDYASQKLSSLGREETNTRLDHARHFLGTVLDQFEAMASRGQAVVLDYVEREAANLMSAWRCAIDVEPETASVERTEALFYCLALRARYVDAASCFGPGDRGQPSSYHLSLFANCQVQLGDLAGAAESASAALRDDFATPTARAHALHALGLVAHGSGEFIRARELYHWALELRREQSDLMGAYYSLASLGVLSLLRGDLNEARTCIKESHRLCQKLGNVSGMMIVHFLAGEVAAQEGRGDDAKENYRQSLNIEEALHHPQHRARILISLGALLANEGQHAAAMECHQQAIDLAREVGDQHRAAAALAELGADLRLAGRIDQARMRLIEAIRIVLPLNAQPLLMRCLFELARLEAAAGAYDRARELSSIIAAGELGPLQRAFDVFASELPEARVAKGDSTPDALARRIIDEADVASLRL